MGKYLCYLYSFSISLGSSCRVHVFSQKPLSGENTEGLPEALTELDARYLGRGHTASVSLEVCLGAGEHMSLCELNQIFFVNFVDSLLLGLRHSSALAKGFCS